MNGPDWVSRILSTASSKFVCFFEIAYGTAARGMSGRRMVRERAWEGMLGSRGDSTDRSSQTDSLANGRDAGHG